MSKKLDHMKDQKEKAEQKLRYYQHQEKMLEHRIPELTRKARIHRLCTRGGMLESFLICPGELTDDQVMELLKRSFCREEVVLADTSCPFMDLPPGNILRCKLFLSGKVTIHLFQKVTSRSIIAVNCKM